MAENQSNTQRDAEASGNAPRMSPIGARPGGQQLFGDEAQRAMGSQVSVGDAGGASVDARGFATSEITPAEEGETVELTQHLVLIVRDPMVKIPKHVYDHELEILRRINGLDAVEEVSDRQVKVSNFTVEGEYDRLVRIHGVDVVNEVYGTTPRDLADELGLPYRRQRGARVVREQAMSQQVDNESEAADRTSTVSSAERGTNLDTAQRTAAADAAASRLTSVAGESTAASRATGPARTVAAKQSRATTAKPAGTKPAAKAKAKK